MDLFNSSQGRNLSKCVCHFKSKPLVNVLWSIIFQQVFIHCTGALTSFLGYNPGAVFMDTHGWYRKRWLKSVWKLSSTYLLFNMHIATSEKKQNPLDLTWLLMTNSYSLLLISFLLSGLIEVVFCGLFFILILFFPLKFLLPLEPSSKIESLWGLLSHKRWGERKLLMGRGSVLSFTRGRYYHPLPGLESWKHLVVAPDRGKIVSLLVPSTFCAYIPF